MTSIQKGIYSDLEVWMKYKATFSLIFEDYYFFLNKSHLIVQKKHKKQKTRIKFVTD